MCTAMLYDPADHYEPEETQEYFEQKSKVYERLMKFKQSTFYKSISQKRKQKKMNRKRAFIRFIILHVFFVVKMQALFIFLIYKIGNHKSEYQK